MSANPETRNKHLRRVVATVLSGNGSARNLLSSRDLIGAETSGTNSASAASSPSLHRTRRIGHSFLRDRRRVHNTLLRPYHPHRISARVSVSKKNPNSDEHFDRCFSLYRSRSQRSSKSAYGSIRPHSVLGEAERPVATTFAKS